MKKRVIIIIAAVVIILAAIAAGFLLSDKTPMASDKTVSTEEISSKTEVTRTGDSQEALMQKISALTDRKIAENFYADYDGDGKNELFAVTGEVGELDDNEIWFASESETKNILSSGALSVYEIETPKVGNKQTLFIAECGGGGSATASKWFYIKDGKLCEGEQFFSCLSQYEGNDFTFVSHAFDEGKDIKTHQKTGHTRRLYFLKWNGSEFEEYRGRKISANELKEYENGEKILNEIKNLGYTVDDVFIRYNDSIININIHKEDGGFINYENVNLKVENGALTPFNPYENDGNIVEKTSFGGIYSEGIFE